MEVQEEGMGWRKNLSEIKVNESVLDILLKKKIKYFKIEIRLLFYLFNFPIYIFLNGNVLFYINIQLKINSC